MWSAIHTQTGEAVTAVNEPYNGTLAAGGSVSFGFTGTFTANDTAPATFKVNAATCTWPRRAEDIPALHRRRGNIFTRGRR